MKTLAIIGSALVAIMTLLTGVTVAAVVGVAMLLSNQFGERIEIKNGELYYTENVTEDQATELAQMLEENFGELSNFKSFQLDRDGENLIVRMCAESRAWETNDLDYSFRAMEVLLETELSFDENMVFQVCDRQLQPMKTFDEIN